MSNRNKGKQYIYALLYVPMPTAIHTVQGVLTVFVLWTPFSVW